jgi:RNA polymerase sigma factor (sigma-70 family)
MRTARLDHRLGRMQPGSNDHPSDSSEQSRRLVDFEERNWLPRHCRGDRAAFPALLAAYRRPLYGYLVRSEVRVEERDDLFQSIVLKVHQAAASYQPARPLRPWLFVIAANTVRNHLRDRQGPANIFSDIDSAAVEPVDPQPGPDRIAESRETLAWLEQAIAELPPSQRQALMLVTIAGLDQQDAAVALDLPLNTVKTHLRRARLGLAQALRDRDTPSAAPGGPDEHL